MGFLAPALPWIAKGGAALMGGLLGKKSQANAQQRSPEEAQALTGAQTAAGNLTSTGTSLINQGQSTQAPATSYYDTLLHGNRAAQSQAVAAPRGAISDTYRGAERGLEHSGVRGAAADVAKADLNRQKAGQISSLVTGVQPGAANALENVGAQQTSTGAPMLGQAGSIFSNLLGQGANNRQYARAEGEKTGTGVGGFLFDMLSGIKGKGGGKSILPSTQTVPNFSSFTPGG